MYFLSRDLHRLIKGNRLDLMLCWRNISTARMQWKTWQTSSERGDGTLRMSCVKWLCVSTILRASLEEQYAKSLQKLSKSTFGDMEEGYRHNTHALLTIIKLYIHLVCSTLGKAWQVLKAELFHRSKAHSDFAAQVGKELLHIIQCHITCMYCYCVSFASILHSFWRR